ncbi:hypothetical protein A3742_00600 [Oleiphilus sp. HI0071]|uniref:sensor domain-containing diguanylate cyclase n=1 Tax=unclassified Oleiphilus TaxID=2631174 RepID=UPI0007C27D79|nr:MULTISPECIES: sensor domain-containing diguanylate cyclase [unclassified Oleiphilus]KZY71028.1 hypothetical protein A3737_11765 [Oleiphilus sp. HI0065]KZY82962.1 hypothetical protein A3742_00600 [Oleiphilus sp. HI0071]KZZ03724.1 hypothetical protein A3744_10420 [Oleiphilus sp. HI0073]KZZ51798.1 hypothetical protein A3760_11720 [Oleiphilus sp. HI0122]KZZ73768.1 hypothetical protein A3765_12235 [Oleiphilus sp. HI0130]KZZ82298.1 hypothetical protein A3767_04590 [Oleiphilus sp. HI0133]
MQKPAKPENERDRIADLHSLNILDTPADKWFEAITGVAKQLFNVPIVAVSLVDENRQWFKSIQGLEVHETGRDESFCGHAILQDDLLYIPDTLRDPVFADNPLVTGEPHIRFYAGCPIVSANGYKLGTICIIDRVPRMFAPGQLNGLRQLALLAELATQVVAGRKVYRSLLDQVSLLDRQTKIDHLTRLWNRRAAEDALEQLASRSNDQGDGFAIAVIDIDSFKAINDQYGHSGGDEVLTELSRRAIAELRDGDILARWGGDEFIVILDCVQAEKVHQLLERFASRICEQAISFDDQQINISLSIGYSVFEVPEHRDWTSVFEAADEAMYESKQEGLGRVTYRAAPSN